MKVWRIWGIYHFKGDKQVEHSPVMLAEALEQLAIQTDGLYIDCTFGRGGHSQGILRQLGGGGRLWALDRDLQAIRSEIAGQLQNDQRFTLSHACFSQLHTLAATADMVGQVDGILMDLGVSSPQLDNPERGFSFLHDGPLDMRMDASAGLSAAQWLAQVPEAELVRVLFEYGEERFARRIAHAVIEQRQQIPLMTTRQLAKLIEGAVPFRDKHKHPATRSFQAIRIAVNQELDELQQVLGHALAVLKPGGRLVVISFHSLEDRMVKRFFRAEAGAKYNPGKFPIREADIAKGLLKKGGKAIKASPEEIAHNPRSRSAVMRVAEKA